MLMDLYDMIVQIWKIQNLKPDGYSTYYQRDFIKISPQSKDMIKSAQCVPLINYSYFGIFPTLLAKVLAPCTPLGSLLWVQGSKVTPDLQINDQSYTMNFSAYNFL